MSYKLWKTDKQCFHTLCYPYPTLLGYIVRLAGDYGGAKTVSSEEKPPTASVASLSRATDFHFKIKQQQETDADGLFVPLVD